MWVRKTYDDLANELDQASQNFVDAYLNETGDLRRRYLRESSEWGVEVLRALALAIRSEQDFGFLGEPEGDVGVLAANTSQSCIEQFLTDYTPPYGANGLPRLGLRQALNKIAHASPTRNGFRVTDERAHEIILSGERIGRLWITVISITRIVEVVRGFGQRGLPEHRLDP